jgi:cell division protein FtsW
VDGVEAFDDSKGTNVGATVAALTGLGADKAPARLVVILGGDGKGQDFTPLAAPLARHARAVATIGRDAAAIEAAIAAGCRRAGAGGLPLQRHATLGRRGLVLRAGRPGDAVLLSPACASLDMFRNYAHRAEVFVAAVQALAAERGCWHDGATPAPAARRLPRWRRLRRGGAGPRAARRPRPCPCATTSTSARRRAVRLSAFDQTLVAVVIALLAFGVVMVYSARSRCPTTRVRQLLAHLLPAAPPAGHGHGARGGAAGGAAADVVLGEARALVFVVALVLLVAVLLPFIGKVVNNSRRWIPLGFMNFQPSELAKLAIALYAANYMVRRMDARENFFRAVTPMVVAVAFVGVLLLRQPDMGAFIVIATIAMGILFLGGVNARMFFLIALVMLVVLGLIILAFDDLRRERILAYLDPWNPKYAQGKGYQLTHSLIALGPRRDLRPGPGRSVEKLHYLPEAHTDFLLAVIGEELGFVGVATVIGAFFWLTRRIFVIGRQAIALDRVFAGLMCQGIGIWIGFQAFINMGVNLGVLPTKGLTLPLMSYGGSAILMNLVALAMVLRVDIENRALMRGGRDEPGMSPFGLSLSKPRAARSSTLRQAQRKRGCHGRGHRRARDARALAVAREMQRARLARVSWLGTTHGMENRLVPPPRGIPMDTIRFSGLRGKGLLHTATGGLRLLKAFWDCLRILRRRGADAVLGMGGYVCFPGGLMASLLNKPLVLVNADAALLLSNKQPAAGGRPRGLRLRRPGGAAHEERRGHRQPGARRDRGLPAPRERWAGRSGPLRLLVVGGSLGAQVLNQTLPAALALLPARRAAAGAAPDRRRRRGRGARGLRRRRHQRRGAPFIDDMPAQLAACDLMVCRAGAITVSELCAAGVPAMLVPLIVSTTAHQRDNAPGWPARARPCTCRRPS